MGMNSTTRLLKDYRARTDFISVHEFGGKLLKKSHAKEERPFSRTRSLHFIFSIQKKWAQDLNKKKTRIKIEQKLNALAKTFQIKLKSRKFHSGMIQIILKANSKAELNNFLRSFSGLVARTATGVEKGSTPLKQKFFLQRPFSRILKTKRYQTAMSSTQTKALKLAGMIFEPTILNSA